MFHSPLPPPPPARTQFKTYLFPFIRGGTADLPHVWQTPSSYSSQKVEVVRYFQTLNLSRLQAAADQPLYLEVQLYREPSLPLPPLERESSLSFFLSFFLSFSFPEEGERETREGGRMRRRENQVSQAHFPPTGLSLSLSLFPLSLLPYSLVS